ncbi:MAG: 4Fe-4S dicluster domain-containing protein [Chloroflexi bacterium]|nr:4Fe-4S dicluster domain-containing protein [Chloroflexota bacterium]
MVIDLDKCVACQGCTAACRAENNVPFQGPEGTAQGRAMFWNEVIPVVEGEYPDVKARFFPRPCMHCERPPCVFVCPVGATYQDEDGVVRQNYSRCIGCRFCTVACPYGVRYFNWFKPNFPEPMVAYTNPDPEVPVRPKGIVEKCVFCIQRINKAKEKAAAEGRELKDGDIAPACVQTCTGRARYFGDLDNPDSTVSRLVKSTRAFRLLEELGTHPKVYYLMEG